MKRINLSITKCTNPKCGFQVISETIRKRCPICKSKMVKDKESHAQGLMDIDDPCIILKQKRKTNDSNRPKNIKKEK